MIENLQHSKLGILKFNLVVTRWIFLLASLQAHARKWNSKRMPRSSKAEFSVEVDYDNLVFLTSFCLYFFVLLMTFFYFLMYFPMTDKKLSYSTVCKHKLSLSCLSWSTVHVTTNWAYLGRELAAYLGPQCVLSKLHLMAAALDTEAYLTIKGKETWMYLFYVCKSVASFELCASFIKRQSIISLWSSSTMPCQWCDIVQNEGSLLFPLPWRCLMDSEAREFYS